MYLTAYIFLLFQYKEKYDSVIAGRHCGCVITANTSSYLPNKGGMLQLITPYFCYVWGKDLFYYWIKLIHKFCRLFNTAKTLCCIRETDWDVGQLSNSVNAVHRHIKNLVYCHFKLFIFDPIYAETKSILTYWLGRIWSRRFIAIHVIKFLFLSRDSLYKKVHLLYLYLKYF